MRELRDSKGQFVAGHKKIGGMPKGGHQTEETKNRISASLVGKIAAITASGIYEIDQNYEPPRVTKKEAENAKN